MKTLHILNGDSTLFQFQKTQLSGDIFVWREILCEGKITSEVGNNCFWQEREKWMAHFSEGGIEEYQHKFKNPFQQVDISLSLYNEIVLWFEYDLFCQVNLIAVLSWLYKLQMEHTRVSLICIGAFKKYEKKVGLGEISWKEYPVLYKERAYLTSSDLVFASNIWKIYRSPNHLKLIPAIKKVANTNFPYLLPAFKAHLRRFPNTENGLTEIETNIARLAENNFISIREAIGKLLRKENYYGFGDLQYLNLIEQLSPILIQKSAQIKLNDLGNSILRQEEDFMPHRCIFPEYGGSDIRNFRWNPRLNKLVSNPTTL